MKDFRVEVRVKNARLYNLIMSSYASVAAFSRESGFNNQEVGALINFKLKPLKESGSGWTDLAKKLSEYFGELPEDIWPESMADLKLSLNSSSFDLHQEELARLSQKTDSFKCISDEVALKALNEAVDGLTTRESKILAMRFGLSGCDEVSLDAVARVFGVSRERIRQIEQKALRKLRNPSRSSAFSDYIYEPKLPEDED